jgi:hypothetical protein
MSTDNKSGVNFGGGYRYSPQGGMTNSKTTESDYNNYSSDSPNDETVPSGAPWHKPNPPRKTRKNKNRLQANSKKRTIRCIKP